MSGMGLSLVSQSTRVGFMVVVFLACYFIMIPLGDQNDLRNMLRA